MPDHDVTGASERLQPLDADAGPHWRDEVELHAWDPGSGLFVLARLTVLPNRPAATVGVLAWAGGRPAYVYGHAVDEVPLADWDDLSIAAARLQELEPLRSWELNLDDGVNGLSLRWDGRSAALPTGHRRYEQSGYVVGRVVLNSQSIAVDGVGHRTHAWGDPSGDHPGTVRAIGFLGAPDAAKPDQRAFTVTIARNGVRAGFVHEDGADHAIASAEVDDGGPLRLTTDDGRTSTIATSDHGEAIPLPTGDARGTIGHQQLTRFSADDGLEGYGLVERTGPAAART